MHAYIDESGDTGTRGKGSRWLIFGCAMIADSHIEEAQSAIQEVRDRVDRQRGNYLHFRDISHDDKVGALNLIAKMPWTGVIVASDTTETPVSNPRLFYDVTAVHVIERVLSYARELRETANIYFEISRNLHLGELASLVRLMLTRAQSGIEPQTVAPYQVQGIRKGSAHGLDIADGLAHAAFRALEPNRKWGHFEPTYLNILEPRLWRGPSNAGLEGWGLALMPPELSERFRQAYPWLP